MSKHSQIDDGHHGGMYAVANAMILHGHKFGDPVKDGPFASPARIQAIIETARRKNLQTS